MEAREKIEKNLITEKEKWEIGKNDWFGKHNFLDYWTRKIEKKLFLFEKLEIFKILNSKKQKQRFWQFFLKSKSEKSQFFRCFDWFKNKISEKIIFLNKYFENCKKKRKKCSKNWVKYKIGDIFLKYQQKKTIKK